MSQAEAYGKRISTLCDELIAAGAARRGGGVRLQRRFCSHKAIENVLRERGYKLTKLDHTGWIAEPLQ